ncbi:MAG: hypothetical protein ABL908_13805 [Hyphomicrobium sp.]
MVLVYDVMHWIERFGQIDRKGIGVYSTRKRAESAISSVSTKPGFKDSSQNFRINEVVMDRSYWPSGFDQPGGGKGHAVAAGAVAANPGQTIWQLYMENTSGLPEDDDDFVLIGYYSSRTKAHLDQLALEPEVAGIGRKYALNLSISVIDRVEWSEGFMSGTES